MQSDSSIMQLVSPVILMRSRLYEPGLQAKDVGGAGDCFFRSVSHQLHGNNNHHMQVHIAGVQYMRDHPERFVESNTDNSWLRYLNDMCIQGTWSDGLIVQAVADALNVVIHIVESNPGFSPITTDDRILEHLIQTVKDSELVKRSIQKKWNLDQFLEEASQREDINQQVKDMKEDFKISKVEYQSKDFPKSGKWGGRRNSKKKPLRPPRKRENKKEEKEKGKSCGYCGKTGAHPPGRNCPAYGQQCLKCGKYNHYASCCRIGAQPQEGSKETKRGRIKKTTEAEETSSDSDDDYIYLQETAQHLHRVKKIRSGPNQDTVLIRIGDIDAFVEPDSGASANVMDEYQFKALKHRSQEIKELDPSRDTLKTLQSDLTVKGEFTTTLRNKNRGTQSKFLVIQGKMDSPPLLSKSTLLELGMLKIDPEGTLKETNELRIKTVKTPDDSIEAALSEYSDVFQGIGCFREKSTGKKIEVKLEMEPDAEPVAQKPRPVPYHLQKPLKVAR